MIEQVLQFLEDFGLIGLYVAAALEASSLPFPGALFVLIYGYAMKVGYWHLIWISFTTSLIFTAFSLIPFKIGNQLGNISEKKWNSTKLNKAQSWFRKYGNWSIALSRPLSIGNYISYISGISRVATWRFILFTFLGVFPWYTLLLFLGYSSSLTRIQELLDFLKTSGIYVMLGVLVSLILWFFFHQRKRKKKDLSTKNHLSNHNVE